MKPPTSPFDPALSCDGGGFSPGLPFPSRRQWATTASLAGLGWITSTARHLARGAERGLSRPKSLILLWMEGGMSQLDGFDPHPGSAAAAGARSIATAVKGLRFGEGLPRTAELAADLVLLRSVTSREGDHSRASYEAQTGQRPLPGLIHPSLGSIICHELADDSGGALDLPAHISILSSSSPARGGYLGARYDAFQMEDPVRPLPDLRASVSGERLGKRIESLDLLERSFAAGRRAEPGGPRALHREAVEGARRLMSSDQLAAFDVDEAPASEREAYGDSAFGRSCLAALRLIGAGVRCVQVTLRGWDSHVDNAATQARQLAILDPALASLIRGLKERGLYDDTLLVVGTEFGRSPRVNLAGGRDHWPHGFSVVLGGGGWRGGIALGETDPTGESRRPAREIRVEDIHATILRRLGIDPSAERVTPLGRPIALSEGRLIRELG